MLSPRVMSYYVGKETLSFSAGSCSQALTEFHLLQAIFKLNSNHCMVSGVCHACQIGVHVKADFVGLSMISLGKAM